MEQFKIIFAGGGSGGHIFPAISIAKFLEKKFKNIAILFVGALGKMEMEKVPKAGYDIKGLKIRGFQRGSLVKNLFLPFLILFSLIKAWYILRSFKPNMVVGTGGFVSGPVLYVATLMGIPTLIQEQNSYAGITNKILGKRVDYIATAYNGMEKYFPKHKIIKTGNPIRENITSLTITSEEAKLKFGFGDTQNQVVFVIGGSLGAKRINQLIASKIEFFKSHNVNVIWQCGKLYWDQYKSFDINSNVYITPFINSMEDAYAAADCIISRAGATTLSELSVVGKPMILIPSPNVAENHQYHNALNFESNNAALLIQEKDLETQFENDFLKLFNSKSEQSKMCKNLKSMAMPNATETICNLIEDRLS